MSDDRPPTPPGTPGSSGSPEGFGAREVTGIRSARAFHPTMAPGESAGGDIKGPLTGLSSHGTTSHGGGSMKTLEEYTPPSPRNLQESGLSEPFVAELILKTLYFNGEMVGNRVAENICLAFQSIIYPILNKLKEERLVEVKGGGSMQATTWRFALTEKGHNLCLQVMERNQYVGPAPVTLADYTDIVKKQFFPQDCSYEDVRKTFDDLVVEDDLIEKVGSAVMSCKSLFLYGPPGNGKTSVAERICNVMKGAIYVPHAIEVANQVIKLYDPLDHRPPKGIVPPASYDRRWMLCRRPMIVVGGELTLNMLDLSYNSAEKFYEAPFQLKSNGGLLLIDDFGRQMCHPKDLLNRWIVPLEKGTDYLTLHTGKKFEAPFKQLVVFSTNLEPKSLVDDAFLRRLRYKIQITDPSEKIFRSIVKMVCDRKGVQFEADGLDYMVEHYYKQRNTPFRACHPRDLVEIMIDKARFRQRVPRLERSAIDEAWNAYFVT